MVYDDDKSDDVIETEAETEVAEESGCESRSANESETPSTAPDDPRRELASVTEESEPQPDHDSLEVVTTSPEDGRSGPGNRRRERHYNSRPGGLAKDDPFWTFGTPPESWGSSVKKPDDGDARARRPRMYLECRSCGVKIEKKRAHGRGKVPCSMCGRWMQPSRQD